MPTKLKVVTRQTNEIPGRPTEYTIGMEEVSQEVPADMSRADRPITFSFTTTNEERGKGFAPGKLFELVEKAEES